MKFDVRRPAVTVLGWCTLLSTGMAAQHAAPNDAPDSKIAVVPEPTESPRYLRDEHQTTQGAVTIAGRAVAYQAEAGVLVVHVKDPMDDDAPPPKEERTGPPPPQPPEASMSYVAYFKGDKEDIHRPVTFIFNGGPGSSTVWLHMGAFGPKRVVTLDDKHSPAAPYRVIDNEYSLIDASDLVFIDAPGTGFGHLRGADKEKAFFGVDQDAHAFANFIVEFLSRHNRWNSPKYLFGESYGTTRSAALVNILQSEQSLDLNGVILLSQILNFDDSADQPQFNPGVDLPYVLALPTYAATAWYHHKLTPQPASLEPLLREVENFALTDYAQALAAGSTLSKERKSAIAAKLSGYTGLPVDYIERANLRVNGGEFEKTLMGSDLTTGRLDTRFSGPTIDPMSKESDYDPQSAAISSVYVSAFNDYVRTTLKFGDKKTYKPITDIGNHWDMGHQPPGSEQKISGPTNVMPDLAVAMKTNPNLKVQLNGGYYDLATPYFAAVYELHQLPIQASLQDNIDMHFYTSGHMVYAHEPDLKALHANVAAFIDRTKKFQRPLAMLDLKALVTNVPDFPRAGVMFRDISPLLREHLDATLQALESLLDETEWQRVDALAGIESRGFILGAALAARRGKGFILVRKQGKLPPPVVDIAYDLEYGSGVLEMQRGRGRILLIDDVLATGGTMTASAELCLRAGYEVMALLALIDLRIVGNYRWRSLSVRASISY